MSVFRSYAIIPAAGHSRRMARHKLLLPWKNSTVIENVLAAWTESRVTRAIVVIRRSDQELQAACCRADVDLVLPRTDPSDMKISVQHALTHIQHSYAPLETDAWLLAPADVPRISSTVVDQVLDAYATCSPAVGDRQIVVPTFRGQAGHPVVFPWRLYREVYALGPDEGVNALLKRHPATELALGSEDILADLDTPADYERLRTDKSIKRNRNS